MPGDKNAKIGTWLKPVSYARLAAVSHAFQRWRICPFPVEEVMGRLRAAIEAAGFWNLHVIDSQALLSQEGYAISPARQLLFFDPRHVAHILTADPAALLEVPLKFIVLELPEGGVTVRWADPLASFARYRNLELEELGRELSEACDGIVGAVLKPHSPPLQPTED
jgi:uncharacterized protein (DUF302 family)